MKLLKKILISVLCPLAASIALAAPLKTLDIVEIWPNGVAPGSENSTVKLTIAESSTNAFFPERSLTGITRPNLTAFVPDKPNGTAVIITAGGGYARIMLDKEGAEMARWLNTYGVTAFVMQYRLPSEGHMNGRDAPFADAQRAIRIVRDHATDWGLSKNKIGFLGSSAGGHIGAMLGTKFDQRIYEPIDAIDKLSARPDFMVLLYPVISMEEKITHPGSRKNLLGENPSPELIRNYSADQQVQPQSPPTLLVAAEDDEKVPVENSIRYHEALKKSGVPTALYTFKEGKHGFAIRDTRQLPVSNWPNLAAEWLRQGGFIK